MPKDYNSQSNIGQKGRRKEFTNSQRNEFPTAKGEKIQKATTLIDEEFR